MKLNDIERNSPVWVKLEKYIKEEIDVLRVKNDTDLDQVSTARIRGRILALKKILALATEELPPLVE